MKSLKNLKSVKTLRRMSTAGDMALGFLKHTTVKDVSAGPNMVVIPADTLLKDVLRWFRIKGITSAPVVRDGEFIGTLAAMDIVRIVSRLASSGAVDTTLLERRIGDLLKEEPSLDSRKANAIHAEGSILQLVELFQEPQPQVLTYVELEGVNTFVGFVSCSDVVSFLAAHRNVGHLGSLRDTTLSRTCNRHIVKVDSKRDTALEAFHQMALSDGQSVAVMDPDKDEFIAELTPSSLCALQDMQDLNLSIENYLEKHKPATRPAVISESSSLEDALHEMDTRNLHAIWVTHTHQGLDSEVPRKGLYDGPPVGILTQWDMMRMIIKHVPAIFL